MVSGIFGVKLKEFRRKEESAGVFEADLTAGGFYTRRYDRDAMSRGYV